MRSNPGTNSKVADISKDGRLVTVKDQQYIATGCNCW